MNKTDLNSQATQTSDEMSSSTEQNKETSLNGTSVKTAESSNQPDKAQQTQTKENDLSKHMTQVAASVLGGKFEQIDGNDLPEQYRGAHATTQRFKGEAIEAEANIYSINQPKESEQSQNVEQPKEEPNPQRPNGQPNLNKVSNPERTSTADEASAASGVDDKKEANNDDDSGVNLAEFFRAKNNIDAHQSKNGKGEKLDDALVQCLRKVSGVKIIKSKFFEKFGEPIAIQYYGVRMSFHGGHVVASGGGKVREIVQSLLTKIKPEEIIVDNTKVIKIQSDPANGILSIDGKKSYWPIKRENIIVLNQNSNGDCAFDHEALKDSNSSTSKVATQLITLSKSSILCQKYFPGIDFEKSVSQMQSNSSDPEKSKNNVHPFKQGSFLTVSGQLNVVSRWINNNTHRSALQDLGVLYPDLLLDIYDAICEQYAQEEEDAKDQQDQAKEVAKRTINEYNLFSGQKLEENSEIAARAFLERLHQDNPQILALESSLTNSDSGVGLTDDEIAQTIAQNRNTIMQSALEEARQAQNAQAPNFIDFPNSISNSEPADSEDNNLSSDSNSSSKVDNDNKNNKSGQSANSNRNEIASESTDNDNDPENLNAQPVERNNSNFYDTLRENPFDGNDDDDD